MVYLNKSQQCTASCPLGDRTWSLRPVGTESKCIDIRNARPSRIRITAHPGATHIPTPRSRPFATGRLQLTTVFSHAGAHIFCTKSTPISFSWSEINREYPRPNGMRTQSIAILGTDNQPSSTTDRGHGPKASARSAPPQVFCTKSALISFSWSEISREYPRPNGMRTKSIATLATDNQPSSTTDRGYGPKASARSAAPQIFCTKSTLISFGWSESWGMYPRGMGSRGTSAHLRSEPEGAGKGPQRVTEEG